MADETEYEYDLAVSFAGEQRDYARGVVRGLDDNLNVFYDEDNKADMLGEDLIEYFTDMYQHRARYVAMFVSAEYERKMWTNVERRSALARAAQQRTAYILPIRMDDTQLPGLLPTVGFADARVEGLGGVIAILRQKLGADRVSAAYSGRVPRTQADIDLLLALRPDWWDYWLYAGTLHVGMEALEHKYRDYELGFAPMTGEAYFDKDAVTFLRTVFARSTSLSRNFEAILTHEAQQRAFGEDSDSADAARIMHLAQRYLDTYEAFMDEAARIRGAALPDEYATAQAAASEFGAEAVKEFRAFVDRCVESMDTLPDVAADRSEDDDPLEITLTVRLTVNPEVSRRYRAGLREAAAASGIVLDLDEEADADEAAD